MNIGIVTTWFERGAAYVSKQYMELLENNDNNIYIYARGGEEFAKGDPNWDGPNIWWGKNYHSVSTKISFKDFDKWLKKNEIEILLFNEQHIWNPLIKLYGRNIITGAYVDYYTEETINLFGTYDFLICNTQRHHSVFEWHPQVHFLPWGTNTELFKPLPQNEVRDKISFFHSAGMNPFRKGTDVILKACESLINENFHLTIHTQTNLEDFFPELSSLIKVLENSGKLKIINKTVSAPGLYYLGDVYLYPTRLEGIGLTIHEACSSGLPVITTNEAPMNEFINPEYNGKIIAINSRTKRSDGYYWNMVEPDYLDLAKQMKYYIQNFQSIENFKVKAREHAENHFNWLNNKDQLIEIFSSVKSLNDTFQKREAVDSATAFEKKRPLKYSLNTYKPYISIKQLIKNIFRSHN